MNDVDDLPNWAGRALQTGAMPVVAETPQTGGGGGRRGVRALLFGLLGLLLLGGIGAAGYWFATQQNGDDDVATDATTDTSAAATDDSTADQVAADEEAESPTTETTAAETTSTVADETEAETDDGESTGVAAESDGTLEAPADYESSDPQFADRASTYTRYTVIKGGQVYLYGFVDSEELAGQIVEVSGGVVGPDNVFDEQIIDPDTPDIESAPVFVDDRVLFGFNSVAVEPVFEPILDLGVLLMTQNPSVTLTVVSRTDSVGSEAINQEVSEQRAQAVVDYWVGKGISPDRITIDARGESDANEQDDDQTAAVNRSVEFRIANLFSS